jgi:hypothetical protein
MKPTFDDILSACGEVLFFIFLLFQFLIFPAQTVSSVPAMET